MPASDPLDILLVTNQWANRNMIQAARAGHLATAPAV